MPKPLRKKRPQYREIFRFPLTRTRLGLYDGVYKWYSFPAPYYGPDHPWNFPKLTSYTVTGYLLAVLKKMRQELGRIVCTQALLSMAICLRLSLMLWRSYCRFGHSMRRMNCVLFRTFGVSLRKGPKFFETRSEFTQSQAHVDTWKAYKHWANLKYPEQPEFIFKEKEKDEMSFDLLKFMCHFGMKTDNDIPLLRMAQMEQKTFVTLISPKEAFVIAKAKLRDKIDDLKAQLDVAENNLAKVEAIGAAGYHKLHQEWVTGKKEEAEPLPVIVVEDKPSVTKPAEKPTKDPKVTKLSDWKKQDDGPTDKS